MNRPRKAPLVTDEDRKAIRLRRIKKYRRAAKVRNKERKKADMEEKRKVAQSKAHLEEVERQREIRRMLRAGEAKMRKDGAVVKVRTNAVGEKVLSVGSRDKREDKFLVQKILKALKAGHTDKEAAIFAGIRPHLLYQWMREGEDAPEGTLAYKFREQADLAKSEALNEYLQSIRRASKRNWQAAAWWLEKRKPEVYGKKAELMLTQEKPFEVALADASFSEDEVKAAMRAFLAANPEVLNPPQKVPSITENSSNTENADFEEVQGE